MSPHPRACRIGQALFGGDVPAVIAGPCVAESLELCLTVAETLRDACAAVGLPYVFKASYDKANRSRADSFRGPGLRTGLQWLGEVRDRVGVAVVSDVHTPDEAAEAGKVLDAVQVPAFLCRQTDLLLAAGESGACVNVKKGQFMAPWDMGNAVEKVRSTGNDRVLLTERGTTFGYNRLVSDFRGLSVMRDFAPVVFDATHSTQEPGGLGSASGGQPRFARPLALAALAAGADALFIETHPRPDEAKSDAACMIPLEDMPHLLARCLAVFRAARGLDAP